MPPDQCDGCELCGTNLSSHPDFHHPPTPHEFIPTKVETDDGGAVLSRCRYCHLTKGEIAKGESQ